MWNCEKLIFIDWLVNRLITVKIKDVVWTFKCTLVASSVFYVFFFGADVAILFSLSCLLLYHLPVLLIYCNQLGFGIPKTPVPPREHRELSTNSSPLYFLHEEVLISSDINNSLESFFSTIIERFVTSWHSQFEAKEPIFIHELKHAVRHTVITLFNMVRKADIPKLIIDQMIPTFIWHLDCYNSGHEWSDHLSLEQRVLLQIGNNLHPAACSRKQEEQYLLHYTEKLLKRLLPKQLRRSKMLITLLRDLVSCQILQKAMDAVADPDCINQLISLWLSEDKLLEETQPELVNFVPILDKFTTICATESARKIVYPSLPLILKTPAHLYHFMQFLKREGTLKYLQFCFAVDEFNEKLLNPDLNRNQLERLQLTAQKMFDIYVCQQSPDCINFGPDFESQMSVIVHSRDPNDIVLLRTSPILFKAYDHVMDILEQQLMPARFYRSPEFYHLICGMQQTGGSTKNAKKKAQSLIAGWGAKLRGALRPPGWPLNDSRLMANSSDAEEESSYDTGIDLTEVDFIPDDMDSEQETPGAYADLIPICGRDLTAWRVCIPHVVTAIDSAAKPVGAFEIDIQRVDLRPEDDPEEYHWSVIRTYQEFYNLESKLVEFHGEFIDIRLPAKKVFGTKNVEFLQTVRAEFEQYLRALLQQPTLKGSDLIFSFLTLSDLSASHPIGDGALLGSNLLPNLGLGRMIRHVPFKLRKERGQHLETFLQTFVASTEAPKPRPSKNENPNNSEVSVPVMKQLHPLFQDNAKTFLQSIEQTNRLPRPIPPLEFDSPYEYLLYMAWKIWKVPQLVWNMLVGLRSVLASTVETWGHQYVETTLGRALEPRKIVLVIELLHELVVDESSAQVRRAHEHRRAARDCISKALPDWSKRFLGSETKAELIFQCLQYPVLNKQLSYALLDLLLRQICPEIFENTR